MPLNTLTPSPAPTAPPRAGLREWLALFVLILPVLVVSLDNTALSFAVPQLSAALNPSGAGLLWIVDIYPLMLAGLLMTMGMLGDKVGRRRLLLIGTAGFGLVSLYAAFAPDALHLIAARALLGVFGAMLMPSTLSLLRNVFVNDDERRLAIAVWASGFAGGSALGPIVGGWLLEHFWWGSIFLVSVPPVFILLVAAPFLLPESRNPNAGRLDPVGVLMSIFAMLPLVFGIKHVAAQGLDPVAIASLGFGALVGAAFVHRQIHRPDPLLDLRLFTRPVFAASVAANFMSVFAFAGLIFYMSQHLQFVEGKAPLEASMSLIPGAIASIAMGLLAVSLAKVVPVRHLVPLGILLASGGYLLGTTLHVGSPGIVIVLVFALVGAGAGLAETLTNDAILASVPPERAGAASGISETAYELGAALGVAVLGSLLTWRYRAFLVLPAGLPAETEAAAKNTIGSAMSKAPELSPVLESSLVEATRRAFESGVALTSAVGAVVTLLTALGVWFVLYCDHRRSQSPTS
ncbi:MFS transporter [Gephyromycinifex aptenodytis]|uniref:MFS transporter n=1 Tax=Gephyromycinifex aptenodytis TaxID=2716227 RepID=UPI001445252E|nr:MFS transporter [Gephyromycinifex aptenodytis]